MKNSVLALLAVFLIGISTANAQQKTNLSLHDAVSLALIKSDEVILARTKVSTKNYDLGMIKNNRYPDVKISGQYLRLTNADIKLKSSGEASSNPEDDPQSSPKVDQLALAQASLAMPLFSGFKLRNTIAASESLLRAEKASAQYTNEGIVLRVVEYYGELYKAQRSVELFRESLKSGQQRVSDFTAKEQNGIIARNDLLKSQLQVSKIQLSLAEAEKNVRLINYDLVTLLKLPAETQIEVDPDNIDNDLFSKTVQSEENALGSRKDLEALRFEKKAAESDIKIAKADYYPALSLTGGYVALDLKNVVTVQNAMNFGLGLSYNFSSIFKNGTNMKVAKSRALEVSQQEAILTARIKSEIVSARETYDLSLKQDQVYGEAVAQAAENYRIVKDKYDNGLSDTNDLLEADVEDLGAKINQAYAKANVILKYYELLEATGQLTQSFNLTK